MSTGLRVTVRRLLRKWYFTENENSGSMACKNGSQMRSSSTMSKNRTVRQWRNLSPTPRLLHRLFVYCLSKREQISHTLYNRVFVLIILFLFFINKILYPLTLFRIEIIVKYSQHCFEWTGNNNNTKLSSNASKRRFRNNPLFNEMFGFKIKWWKNCCFVNKLKCSI